MVCHILQQDKIFYPDSDIQMSVWVYTYNLYVFIQYKQNQLHAQKLT